MTATCIRNEVLAKEAVNSITEVFVDVCSKLNHAVSDVWRSDYETCKYSISYVYICMNNIDNVFIYVYILQSMAMLLQKHKKFSIVTC